MMKPFYTLILVYLITVFVLFAVILSSSWGLFAIIGKLFFSGVILASTVGVIAGNKSEYLDQFSFPKVIKDKLAATGSMVRGFFPILYADTCVYSRTTWWAAATLTVVGSSLFYGISRAVFASNMGIWALIPVGLLGIIMAAASIGAFAGNDRSYVEQYKLPQFGCDFAVKIGAFLNTHLSPMYLSVETEVSDDGLSQTD